MTSKKLLSLALGALILVGPLTTSVQAQISNEDCIAVYRDGYLDLRDYIIEYNNKSLGKGDFIREVTVLSTEITGKRTACLVAESPSVEECVQDYKELYKDLRGKVSLTAVALGNQDSITFSDDSTNARTSIEDDENVIRRFWRGLRNQGSDTAKLGKLALIDVRCL